MEQEEPMNHRVAALAVLLALLLPAPFAAGKEILAPAGWDGASHVAHEWGTFTSLAGSDGSVLDGLMHEETDLPEFVYDLRDRAGVTGVSPKMETPVVYFYSPETIRVRVGVAFPRGTITQWYPAATFVNHSGTMMNGVASSPSGKTISHHADGYIRWGYRNDLEVLARGESVSFPAVAEDDPWRFCREVDANALRVCTINAETDAEGYRKLTFEDERCLFYRGLGDFPLPLEAKVQSERYDMNEYRVRLTLGNAKAGEPLRHVFLVWVKDGRCGFHYVPRLDAEQELELRLPIMPLARASKVLADQMAERLTQTGCSRGPSSTASCRSRSRRAAATTRRPGRSCARSSEGRSSSRPSARPSSNAPYATSRPAITARAKAPAPCSRATAASRSRTSTACWRRPRTRKSRTPRREPSTR
jgi:hypothetical protein